MSTAALLLVVLAPAPASGQSACDNTSTGLIPLIDLDGGAYQGQPGGLYSGGNGLTDQALELGLARAAMVTPLGVDGVAAAEGSIVMVALGVSNTLGEFKAFSALLDMAQDPRLVLVNGAQVGQSINRWIGSRSDGTWDTVERKLTESGVDARQVQVAWIKMPSDDRGPATLEDARIHAEKLENLVRLLPDHFPNIQLAYLSSRSYGGYIPGPDSEPNAYQDGFAVRWAIEGIGTGPDIDPTQGAPELPWVGWGPYLWADGTTPRSDGLFYECSDYQPGGVHPADGATEKIAHLLLDHFRTDPTAANWFGGQRAPTTTAGVTVTTTSPTLTLPESSSPDVVSTPSTTLPLLAEEDVPSERSNLGPIVAAIAGLVIGVVGIRLFQSRRSGP
ncbi:MAG: hypothetical protein ACRDWA_09085 [Acidimicrobiia bacterium]